MRLNIACCPEGYSHTVADVFNAWLPNVCCAAGCNRPAVYKLTGRVPAKRRSRRARPDWLCFEIGLTLCEKHERTDLADELVATPEVQARLHEMARSVMRGKPDLEATEVTMIPFAIGTA